MCNGECALINDKHVQISSGRAVQDITFGDEDGDYCSRLAIALSGLLIIY